MHRFCYNLNTRSDDDVEDAWADNAVTKSMMPFYLYCSAVVLGLLSGVKVWSMTEACGYEKAYTFSSQSRNLASWMCSFTGGDDAVFNGVFWGVLLFAGFWFGLAGGMFD